MTPTCLKGGLGYGVIGRTKYLATSPLVLGGFDGIIYIKDCQLYLMS